jgi:hypothetical protein
MQQRPAESDSTVDRNVRANRRLVLNLYAPVTKVGVGVFLLHTRDAAN